MDNINEKYRNHIKLRRKGPVREERFNYELSDASMFQVGPRPGPWVYQNFGAHSLEKGWVGPGLRGGRSGSPRPVSDSPSFHEPFFSSA